MSASRLKLYTTLLSANGRKPLLVSHHLGLDLEITEIDVYRGEGRSPEYLAVNPWGRIPTLTDGDFTLWESNAIAQYLSEAYADFRLSSRDPQRRADISRWLFWEASHWQPAFVPILSEPVGHLLLGRTEEAEKIEVNWKEPRFWGLATVLDERLAGSEFLVGDELSLADFVVAAMMMYARRVGGFPVDEVPALAAWYERVEQTEAWQATAVTPWKA